MLLRLSKVTSTISFLTLSNFHLKFTTIMIDFNLLSSFPRCLMHGSRSCNCLSNLSCLTVLLSIPFITTFFPDLNPLSANSTKWSNTLKQFVSNLLTNCFSVFDHFVKLALKGSKQFPLPIYGTATSFHHQLQSVLFYPWFGSDFSRNI